MQLHALIRPGVLLATVIDKTGMPTLTTDSLDGALQFAKMTNAAVVYASVIEKDRSTNACVFENGQPVTWAIKKITDKHRSITVWN
jgi:hypothetical protein